MTDTQAGLEADKDLSAVLELLPRLSREALGTVRKKVDELDVARAREEKQADLREIQRLARKHGINVDTGQKKRGRPSSKASAPSP